MHIKFQFLENPYSFSLYYYLLCNILLERAYVIIVKKCVGNKKIRKFYLAFL
jgi:hypothetical protein